MIGRKVAQHVTTVVVLRDLLVGDRGNPVIVVFEPSTVLLRLDEREVMAAMQITGMYENTMKFVHRRWWSLLFIVQELGQVDGEGELVAVVDLTSA
jgi:hypothetical protein